MSASSPRSPGRPEQRAALLAGLVDHVLREGVSSVSLRPLAAAVGTSDRMLLYYFGTRDQLLAAVLGAVGEQLAERLAAALPAEAVPPAQLLDQVWTALGAPGIEAHLRLYVEISGLAARGREPFRTVAARVAEGWVGWVADRLDVPAGERRGAAAAVLTVVDGLLLMRFVLARDAADDAAAWLAARLG